ncbi:MAG TPA: hypothetical protein H9731_01215 [Candidatus Borkfalkia excrementipullorum]|nr:hypothetical protein [Candidatus Borkfalkia excrementipullorum]
MVRYKGKEIIYSFRYSGLMSRKFLAFLYLTFGVVWMALLCGLVAMCIRDGGLNADSTAVLCLMLGFFVIGAFFLAIDLYYRSIEKKYMLWLTDEGLEERSVIPFEYSMRKQGNRKTYRFGVTFSVNGNEITKYNKNYDGFYVLHSEGMQILYSPKFDEVMVLEGSTAEK